MSTWIRKHTGKGVDEISTSEVLKVPRRKDLTYAPLVSPLGGRLDSHLRHLPEDEAEELLRLGDQFLADTPDE